MTGAAASADPGVAAMRAPARRVALVVFAVLAAVGGFVSAWTMWRADGAAAALLALALQVVAALAARAAAHAAGGREAELDLVLVLAVAMPGCGPALAWLIAVGRDAIEVHNAHAAFEAAEAGRTPRAEAPQLERELGVVSHAQVLQHGSLEEKRNLLRRIARLGSPRYLTLLRQFLRDPEPELRLCAYAELARLCQIQEEAIARLRRAADAAGVEADAGRAALLAALAEGNRAYGTSGLLDADMAEYWLRQAALLAEQALATEATCTAAQRVLALSAADLGELERAWSVAAAWPVDAASPLLLARAEVAFRRRDRQACRAAGEVLRARGQALPPWLEAVLGTAVLPGLDRPVPAPAVPLQAMPVPVAVAQEAT